MLFMGEEWNTRRPFQFFCDFGDELAEAVRNGRREEFARFPEFSDPQQRHRIPDPQADSTFESARLDWSAIDAEPHSQWLAWYRRILAVRRESIVPLVPRIGPNAGRHRALGDRAVEVRWRLDGGGELALAANLSASPVSGFAPGQGRLMWCERTRGDARTLDGWAVRWSLEDGGRDDGARP